MEGQISDKPTQRDLDALKAHNQRVEREGRVRELSGAVESSFSIECVGCGNGTTALTTSSLFAAVKEFDAAGWRASYWRARCPECVEKPSTNTDDASSKE